MREFILVNPNTICRWLPPLMATLLLAACGGGDTEPSPQALSRDRNSSPHAASRSIEKTAAQAAGYLLVRAKADVAGGVGAAMEVRVDDILVGRAIVDSNTPQSYRLPATVRSGSRIDITYTNDGSTGGQDRNLHVLYISDGNRFLLPAPTNSTIDRGNGRYAFDGIDVVPGQTTLFWNGTLRMHWPTSAAATTGIQRLQAVRLLQQASFGPTTADIDRAVTLGTTGWINEQLAKPIQDTFVPDLQARFARGAAWRPGGGSYSDQWTTQRFWASATTSPDQLRRRMAFALHHILMVSRAENAFYNQPRAYAQYLDTLNRHAFGNYRQLC